MSHCPTTTGSLQQKLQKIENLMKKIVCNEDDDGGCTHCDGECEGKD